VKLIVTDSIIIIFSYLLGCVSTGYYLIRFKNKSDIRNSGSKSTGATNVGRQLGKIGFTITFFGDMLKGVIAIGIPIYFHSDQLVMSLSLVAVVAGHVWPFQLGFKGGKGIAVLFGALLIYDYRLLLFTVVIFIIIFIFSREYVLSGLISITMMPVAKLITDDSVSNAFGIIIVTYLIVFAHRENIQQILNNENKEELK